MKSLLIAIPLMTGITLSLHAQSVALRAGAGSRITVSGTSNVHNWECSTAALNAAISVPSAGAGELGAKVQSMAISVPVKSLDCGNGQMNSNLAKAMHADAHPAIQYRMTSYTARAGSAGGYQATVAGSLTINGVARPLTLAATVRPTGTGSVRAEGTASFNTTDFGVEPVKAMLGTIKTGERVTIRVTIVGSAPVAVAAASPPAGVPDVATTPVKTAAAPPRKAAPVVPTKATPVVTTKAAPVVTTKATPAKTTPVVAPVAASPASIPAARPDSTIGVPARAAPVVIAPVLPTPATIRIADTVVVRENTGEVIVSDTALAPVAAGDGASADASESRFGVPAIRIQHMRPRDQRGVLMFEAPKQDTVSYTGFTIQWGAAFTQEMQALHHSNTAQPVLVGGVDRNALMTIGGGFNNAVANLSLDAQLARGIRVALTSYLSSRHHSETWVKDGYFLIDASPVENELVDLLMSLVTLKVGHFEVNYGDAHFRRTDNGQAMYNPLIGNLILDGFTTEIGAEGYARLGPILAMAGATGGEIRGQVTGPERRSPAWIGKLGIDRQMSPDLRVRLTGSTYGSAKARSSTLYTGDRAGSPYFMVLENTLATESANAWSGNIRPGFANVVHSYMVNPFVKYRGLELFGTVETSTGKATAEARKRTVRQLAGEGVMRFGATEQLYVAGRYNRVAGQLAGFASDISTDRWQMGGGWFVLPTVLAKAEYVVQRYYGFPATDIRNGGRFSGLIFAGSVAF